MTEKPLVHIENLNVEFPLGRKLFGKPPMLKAVNGVSMDIMPGQFYGLVGESGSGKTTLGRAILKAVPISSGKILYDDGKVSYDLRTISQTDLKNYRKLAQLIFQDPYAALSPRMTVRDIIAEPLEVMEITKSREETDERVRGSHMLFQEGSGSEFQLHERWFVIRNLLLQMKVWPHWMFPFRQIFSIF